MGKPPETAHFAHRWRKSATWGFANGAQATCVDSLAIAADGFQAKERLSFKRAFSALSSLQRRPIVAFGTKTKTQRSEFEKGFEVVPAYVPEADEARHGVTWRHSARDGTENWMQLE